jgi:hypothetical protein
MSRTLLLHASSGVSVRLNHVRSLQLLLSVLWLESEFWREKKQLALVHEQDIRFDGQIHNNKMERMNGEIRDREKVVRGVKKEDSPLITGLQIYHNYVRPHMALDGKTPADLAGIHVEGKDKWLTLIQNARRSHIKLG